MGRAPTNRVVREVLLRSTLPDENLRSHTTARVPRPQCQARAPWCKDEPRSRRTDMKHMVKETTDESERFHCTPATQGYACAVGGIDMQPTVHANQPITSLGAG